MRILITSTGSWGTGSFTVINAITREFLAMGHTVKVFFPDVGVISKDMDNYYQNPELYEIWKFPIEKNGITISTFPLMIPDPHPRNPINLTFKDLSSKELQIYHNALKERIRRVIDEFNPDIIECQHIWILAHIIQELGLPYIVTAHHSDQMGFQFDSRMRDMAANAATNAKYIFTISDLVKNEVEELYHIDQNRIITLYNGYDKTIFNRQLVNREEFLNELGINIPSSANIVTFAGKISYTKGIDIILEANCILDDPRIHFLIFGTGDIKEIIKENCRKAHSLDHLHFMGHQPARILAKAHNISKLSIMPSRSEGFGISCLEAMSCDLPVIVTKHTGAESFAVGEIIEQENPKQLAEAIEALINLPESQYDSLSIKAEETARQFSWETIAQKRLQYYERI
jgi:glycosyltransferase involved in cell wall biosynthesis